MDKTTPMKAKPLVNVTCKLGAKGCFEDGRCHALVKCKNKIETNADRIRSMSDEELAEFFDQFDSICCMCSFQVGCSNIENNICEKGILQWLKSEVKGSE